MTAVESDEQVLFAATTRAFLDRGAPVARLREIHAADGSYEAAWWRQATELGWTALLVPEGLGGGSVSGSGLHDLAMVAEMAGRTAAPGPLHPVSAVLAGLVDAQNSAQHAATIDALVSGETVGTWAVYEPGRPWEPLAPRVTATATEKGFRLDGAKDRVEAGVEAQLVLVVAQCASGVIQLLVPTDAPGVSRTPQPSIDLVKRYAHLEFDGVEVDASAVVGTVDQTPALIERQSDIAMVLQCAETIGILDTVLGFTVDWAFDRHTFGRPLASYQALKHRFADLKTSLEACRATTAHAVNDVATRSPQSGLSVSIAKSYVGERAGDSLQSCIQLHGGIALTWEHDLHIYLRRAALYRAMFGTPEQHNRRVFDQLNGLRGMA